MVASFQPKSTPWQRLTRFVSKGAIALLLKVHPDDISEIRRWANVLLVIGKGISRFVSYADLPPIIGVALPTLQDFLYWRKRWGKIAPNFWAEFYAQQLNQVGYISDLLQLGQVVEAIASLLSNDKAQCLREIYAQRYFVWEAF